MNEELEKGILKGTITGEFEMTEEMRRDTEKFIDDQFHKYGILKENESVSKDFITDPLTGIGYYKKEFNRRYKDRVNLLLREDSIYRKTLIEQMKKAKEGKKVI